MSVPVYELYGLRIRSEVWLPAPVSPGGDTDLEITLEPPRRIPWRDPEGRVLAGVHTDVAAYAAVIAPDGELIVRFHGACEFQLPSEHGKQLAVRLSPDAHPDLATTLLSGTVLALLLKLRGACVLHASAVVVSGAAIGIVGGPGAGKSTLAALLCSDGAAFLTDDVLRVELGVPPMAFPGPREARLRPRADWLRERFATKTHRSTSDGRTALTMRPATGPLPRLAAIILPVLHRKSGTTSLELLTHCRALLQLTAKPRIPGVIDRSLLAQEFRDLATIARSVPIFRATIPWHLHHANALLGRLKSLATTDLLRRATSKSLSNDTNWLHQQKETWHGGRTEQEAAPSPQNSEESERNRPAP